ncbi:Rne/Rng family ribonuclease [Kocuria coralli]|uniref:Ribonuclease E n=1 Tax=Kocuria coralli TaxID=1461025 RepID=A0A5J5KW92_9MICC|nr:Rne/Rng family ribonuclease [Kocuria coralli]KAA9394017.1 Rne/Rng family ribonuclease [Kocuria coralli]
MSTDQVNSASGSSESSGAGNTPETPAETAYQALQSAEAQKDRPAQPELPLTSGTEGAEDAAPEQNAPETAPEPDDGEHGAQQPTESATPSESAASAGSDPASDAESDSSDADAVEDAAVTKAPETPETSETPSEAGDETQDGEAPVDEPTDESAGEPAAAEEPAGDAEDAGNTDDAGNAEDPEEAEDVPGGADPFAAFSMASATSLMFHAPDPDAIKAAAEQAAAAREDARQAAIEEAEAAEEAEFDDPEPGAGVTSKRRRRRRRGSVDMEVEGGNDDDPPNTVTRIRTGRVIDGSTPTTVQSVKGSTRLEAKKQRRRESRQSGRRRQVITEAEFLARRESVERKMVVREKDDRIQIGVLEDGVLAEHFVSHTQQDSLIGNVYLGKVQNVLPSMEAAFVDIGRGRNAVLYAGEVNWDDAELGGSAKRIENALKPGDAVLVQVTKDPVGHKGARLTSQISLPGRYLVYVPGGSMTGISRKLPDVERQRLKKILKDRLPDGAGVIVRTAAEGASEQELANDINRLRSQWEQIQEKAGQGKTLAPEMLYAEPDLTIKTVRDVFNEDFVSMTVQGQQAWDNIEAYVTYVAPDLLDRISQWTEDEDLFEHYKVDEQIYKALDRKVMLPSGGSLVIDRTEAMTVVDVNTGKFTGSGGNLEETVTKNNLEAAEEIVRQLRLRDIGGIIVIDFIDMVLEANRELVLRRLVECLGRDRTKHQVAEVTSLGLVQMTRKRMGTGLLEIFSEPCEACDARGVVIHDHPLKSKGGAPSESNRQHRNERKRSRRSGGSGNSSSGQGNGGGNGSGQTSEDPEQAKRAEATRNAFAAIASASQHDEQEHHGHDDRPGDQHDGDKPSGAARNGKAGSGQSASDSGSEQGGAPDGTSSTGGEKAQGPDDSGDQGDSRDGGKRRRKRRGKRSRNRGQGEQLGETAEGDGGKSTGEGPSEDSDRGAGDGARSGAGEGAAAPERKRKKSPGKGQGPDTGAQRETREPSGRESRAVGEGVPEQGAQQQGEPAGQGAKRRTRGARRAAAPVGTPDVPAQPAQGQPVKVTAGTASVVAGGAGTAEDGSRVTINGEVIELPHRKAAAGAHGAGEGVPSLDSLADSLGERTPGESAPRRKRRSRRASAPTAAPGTAETPAGRAEAGE